MYLHIRIRVYNLQTEVLNIFFNFINLQLPIFNTTDYDKLTTKRMSSSRSTFGKRERICEVGTGLTTYTVKWRMINRIETLSSFLRIFIYSNKKRKEQWKKIHCETNIFNQSRNELNIVLQFFISVHSVPVWEVPTIFWLLASEIPNSCCMTWVAMKQISMSQYISCSCKDT
jgi:hypothetical protein